MLWAPFVLGALHFQLRQACPESRLCTGPTKRRLTRPLRLQASGFGVEGSCCNPSRAELAVGEGVHFHGESREVMLKEAETSHSREVSFCFFKMIHPGVGPRLI